MTERTRGEPLLILGLIVGGWFAMRVLLWQPPFGVSWPATIRAQASATAVNRSALRPAPGASSSETSPRNVPGVNDAPVSDPLPAPWPAGPVRSGPVAAPNAGAPAERIVGQQLLLAAAFTHMGLANEIAAYFKPAGAATGLGASLGGEAPLPGMLRPRAAAETAWSGDAWLMWRNGSGAPLLAAGPSYGRSQAGAVLRYRLAPSSGHRPALYARTTRALDGPREREVAAGFAGRPLSGVPLRLAGEVRISQGPTGTEVRPAAFAVTELPPAELLLGLRGEAYVQAGYVGGHFSTPFVDGQARLDVRVARLGRHAEVRAGGGVWGGAEKDATRLDAGPGAMLGFPLGGTQARMAIDYRFRLAGHAAPESGPALTFSAGF